MMEYAQNTNKKSRSESAKKYNQAPTFASPPTFQRVENNTGLPDNLKAGIENLSGYSMDDVNVHYNSSKPAELQAHAYAQGTDIHVAPGQERHLPHEAWHVVQQKQGRVKPTMQLKVKVNDDASLEKEADVMGGKAILQKNDAKDNLSNLSIGSSVAQLEVRSANPFNQAGTHEGYALTAHHIVPHSKLSLALKLLNNYDNAHKDGSGELLSAESGGIATKTTLGTDVLISSIPTHLSKTSVVNVGIFSEAKAAAIEDEWLSIIQSILKGTKTITEIATDKGEVLDGGKLTLESTIDASVKLILDNNIPDINGNGLNNLRNAFYEWQGGNQFMGPSTDLREEPGSKDEIDFDAQWITAMNAADFEKLTGVKQSKHKAVSKPSGTDLDKSGTNGLGLQLIDALNGKKEDSVPTKTEASSIKTILEGILDLTRDVTPMAFDASKWKEIDSHKEFENLEKDEPLGDGKTKKWGRSGKSVTEHAFFRLKLSDIANIAELAASKSEDSNTAYDYLGTPIGGSKLQAGNGTTQIYLPVHGSKSIVPAPTIESKTIAQILVELGIGVEKGSDIEIDEGAQSAKLIFAKAGGSNRKFTIKDNKDIPPVFINAQSGTITIKKSVLQKDVDIKTANPNTQSLYDFCKNNGMINLSTYMPLGLHQYLES